MGLSWGAAPAESKDTKESTTPPVTAPTRNEKASPPLEDIMAFVCLVKFYILTAELV